MHLAEGAVACELFSGPEQGKIQRNIVSLMKFFNGKCPKLGQLPDI